MADEANQSASTDRWIVLIDKTPRGPLEKMEIELLIEQGVIRRNDLAILVGAPSEKASWQFLWKFPQFDRRKKDGAEESLPATSPATAVEPTPERRTQTPELGVKPGDLPDEVIGIRIEDLLLKSRPVENRNASLATDDDEDEKPAAYVTADQHRSNRVTYWAALAGTLAAAASGIFYFLNSGPGIPASTATHALPFEERKPEAESVSGSSPLSGVTPQHRATAAVPGLVQQNVPKPRSDAPTPGEALPPAEEENSPFEQAQQGQGEVDEDGNLILPPTDDTNGDFPMSKSNMPSRVRRANNPTFTRRPTNVDEGNGINGPLGESVSEEGLPPAENQNQDFPPPEGDE